jgi:hypothetical protein
MHDPVGFGQIQDGLIASRAKLTTDTQDDSGLILTGIGQITGFF